jgi:hypothetical protein
MRRGKARKKIRSYLTADLRFVMTCTRINLRPSTVDLDANSGHDHAKKISEILRRRSQAIRQKVSAGRKRDGSVELYANSGSQNLRHEFKEKTA